MVLDALSKSLKNSIAKIRSAIFVDEKLINELIKDVQRSLLQADVNVSLALEIAQNMREQMKQNPPKGLTKKDYLVHVLYSELARILGGDYAPITITRKSKELPFQILLVGLFGNGKTTHCGKLAKYFSKRGYKVAMVSTDTWRPAAYTQLVQLGKQIGVTVFGDPTKKDPTEIYNSFKKSYQEYDILLIDSAGRDALNEELIAEIDRLYNACKPDETFLTITADVGQAAKKQAETFHKTCHVSGIIVSKMDGTAKGGGALSACAVTGAPVKFIGVGEKIDDIEEFKPKNFVSQLLGMGDLEKLLEKASQAISEEDATDLGKKLLKGEFHLIDMYEQMQAMKKMGPLSQVLELIPGMGQMQIPKEALDVQQEKLETWKYIMDSCTKKELEDPSLIDSQRIARIAKGCGQDEQEVRDLLKHYKQSKKMMKMFKGVNPEDLGEQSQKNPQKMQKMMRKMGNVQNMMKGMFRR